MFIIQGFSSGSVVTNLPANAADVVQSLGLEDPLEKEMATHSNILAWKISCTEEPDKLQSWLHKRAGHDLSTKTTKYITNNKSNRTHIN